MGLYSEEFKAKVVLEIFKEEKNIFQITSEYGIHSNQLFKWEKEEISALAEVFEDDRIRGDKEKEALKNQIQELYTEISKLTTRLNWLKKTGIKLDVG